jgi:hypothetical protein
MNFLPLAPAFASCDSTKIPMRVSPNFKMAVEVEPNAVKQHLKALKAERHDCASGLSLY